MKSAVAIIAVSLLAAVPASADPQRVWVGGWASDTGLIQLLSPSGPENRHLADSLPGKTLHFYAVDGERATAQVREIEISRGDNCGTTITLSGRLPVRENQFVLGSTTMLSVAESKSMDASNPAIATGVSEYLRAMGLQSPKVEVVRVLEADLNGDGTEEVVVEAITAGLNIVSRDRPDAPGDFSVVAVGHWSGGALKVFAHEGYIFGGRVLPASFSVLALPDFLGIGRFDVAVSQSGNEWTGIDVYALSDGAFAPLASALCGL